MDKNIVEDFEYSLCQKCGHKKAFHYTLSRVEEGDPIPPPGCKEDRCDCGGFEKK